MFGVFVKNCVIFMALLGPSRPSRGLENSSGLPNEEVHHVRVSGQGGDFQLLPSTFFKHVMRITGSGSVGASAALGRGAFYVRPCRDSSAFLSSVPSTHAGMAIDTRNFETPLHVDRLNQLHHDHRVVSRLASSITQNFPYRISGSLGTGSEVGRSLSPYLILFLGVPTQFSRQLVRHLFDLGEPVKGFRVCPAKR